MTIQAALTDFLLEQQIRGNSPNTVRYYRVCVRYFMDFAGTDTDMLAVTLPTLKAYYMHLLGKGVSSTTIQTYIRALRSFLAWCHEQEYTPANLAEKFRLPKAQRKVIDVLTNAEVRQLLAVFNPRYLVQLRNLCICSLMLDSGLRMNEVATLTLSALHIAEGYAIVNGKGNKQRIVPLGLNTRKILSRYIARRPACAPTDRLFITHALEPVENTTIKQLFRKLKKTTGIPRLRAHLLRHTFATRFLENGGDMYALQQILGHTSLEMVKKYVHTTTRKIVPTFTSYSPLDNLG